MTIRLRPGFHNMAILRARIISRLDKRLLLI
jgi:hypothetical protein